MREIQSGDIVDIHVKGAQVVNTYGTRVRDLNGTCTDTGTMLVFRHPNDVHDRVHTVNMGAEGVTVERVAPAEWPPRVNDLWRGRTTLWFVMQDRVGNALMTDRSGGRHGPEYVASQDSPLTLVHREEATTDV